MTKKSIFQPLAKKTLRQWPDAQWRQYFTKQPSPSLSGYKELDLSLNQLGREEPLQEKQKWEQIAQFSDTSSIQILNLSNNELWLISTEEEEEKNNHWSNFAASLLRLFPNVTHLNISGNDLYHLYQTNLLSPLGFIAQFEKLGTLDLSNNDFFQGSPEDNIWQRLFQDIQQHKTIKTLILSGNRVNQASLEVLESLKDSLPSIENLVISHDEINSLSPQKLKALQAIAPNARIGEESESLFSCLSRAFHWKR